MAKAPSTPPKSSTSAGALRRGMLAARALGVILGGTISVIACMAVVGLVAESFWVRLGGALVLVVALPAFLADRLLKRTNMRGGLALVGDVFAVTLLAIALLVLAADVVSRPLLAREGDRYARAGATTLARGVYFVAAVTPVFPDADADAGTGDADAGDGAPREAR